MMWVMQQQAPRAVTDKVRLNGSALPVVGVARMYICGITPYDVTHLGHAATFVWADAAAAVLRLAGADAVTCRNVTDVDDVLTAAASDRGRQFDEFALEQEFLFGRDMSALRVRRPAHEPRARHHVADVAQLAAALLALGHAYEREGSVYFRGAHVARRAGLDRGRAEQLCAEYGDAPQDPLRDDPLDVAVWRRSAEAEPGWPSPWGRGRPGWHAECAAMALAVFGPAVDVLAGGADLAFPHHAYQRAMVEAATGVTPFARAALPVGTVLVDGAKMAKSAGNLVLVTELLRDHPPAAIRLMLLNRRWNAPWEHDSAAAGAAAADLERLYAAAGTPTGSASDATAVTGALLDDLDVPRALAVAQEAGGEAARLLVRTLALD